MVNASYSLIFRRIKEIRGYTLEDNPRTWYEIMQAFDVSQNARVSGLQIVQELISRNALLLHIIGSIDGKQCPKYIVASNKIAYNCLEVISDMVDIVCTKASTDDLQPDKERVLSERVIDIQHTLKDIGKLYMSLEVQQIHMDLINRLALAEKHLNAGVVIS